MSETIQIQADWAQTDSTQIDFIKNKPNLYEEWWGTQAEYDAILVKDPDKIYNIKTVYYAVSISAGSNGSVTVNGVTGNYSQSVPSGTTLTIEGTADSNYQFDGWSDGVSTNPRTITVNGNLTLTAAFEIITYSVSISAGSNGSVTVNGVSGDFSDDVASGTVLTVQGTGNNGYLFDEWSDGNTDNPRTITVSGDITLSAAFEAIPNYFYVEDISGSDNTLSIVKSNASAPDITVYKSTDTVNWTSMGTTDTTAITATIPANSKLYLKAEITGWGTNSTNNTKMFASGNHNVGGNIMSLLNGDNFENTTITTTNTFYSLFNGDTKLVSAGNLTLPSNVTIDCYHHMFASCSSLTTAPTTLPATTLASNCYNQMFSGCTSLTTAPVLPATTLADGCYINMFYGCRALTTPPALPALNAPRYCYNAMFQNCIALTTAPALPATTIGDNAYNSMFNGCRHLTSVPTSLPATTLTDACYRDMFNGCTSLTATPELPATTLTGNCYRSMFENCVALTQVSTIAATGMTGNNSCMRMFANCTSLTTAPVLNATTLTANCYQQMFEGCTSLTTAPVLPVTTLADGCYISMFRDCTALTTAPELPANGTLGNNVYKNMFSGCTSLTTAPVIYATVLRGYACCGEMFSGCTNLNNVTMYARNISGTDCLYNWLSGVSATGDFYNLGGATYPSGASGIPTGWTEHTSL